MKKKFSALMLIVFLMFSQCSVLTVHAVSPQHFLNTAKAEYGYKGNPNKYINWYYGHTISSPMPWCHMFVSWVAEKSGGRYLMEQTASCYVGAKWFKDRGQWKSRSSGYRPKPGDIVYFDWPDTSIEYDHVAIVDHISGSRLITIDGNSDSTSVTYRDRDLYSTSILGYGIPAFDNYDPIPGTSGSTAQTDSCSTSYAGTYTYINCPPNTTLKIRSNHGTQYSIVGEIPANASNIKVTKANGTWAHVTYNGMSGYSYMYYLSKNSNTSTGSSSGAATSSIPNITRISSQYNGLKLQWTPAANVTGYQIYRKELGTSKFIGMKTIKGAGSTTWVDTSAKHNHTYYYRIRTYTKIGPEKYVYSKYSTVKGF